RLKSVRVRPRRCAGRGPASATRIPPPAKRRFAVVCALQQKKLGPTSIDFSCALGPSSYILKNLLCHFVHLQHCGVSMSSLAPPSRVEARPTVVDASSIVQPARQGLYDPAHEHD